MVGWHHRLNGHEFEQTRGYSEGKGSLAGLQRVGHDLETEQQQIFSHLYWKFLYIQMISSFFLTSIHYQSERLP